MSDMIGCVFLFLGSESSASFFNPLSPNSDENEISLYIITTCSNIQVMRIKEVITKDDQFSLLVP